MTGNEIVILIVASCFALWFALMWRAAVGDRRRIERAAKDKAERAEREIGEVTDELDGCEIRAGKLATEKGNLQAELDRVRATRNSTAEQLRTTKESLLAAQNAIGRHKTEIGSLRQNLLGEKNRIADLNHDLRTARDRLPKHVRIDFMRGAKGTWGARVFPVDAVTGQKATRLPVLVTPIQERVEDDMALEDAMRAIFIVPNAIDRVESPERKAAERHPVAEAAK